MGVIYFLNVGCADTTIIKSNGDTIMIDCHKIEDYKSLLPTSKKIRALFITHQHYDHFLGMEYLKDSSYSIDYLIYSPYERRNNDNSIEYDEWKTFNQFVKYFENNGTKIYKPFRQEKFDKPYWETSLLKIWMIGPYKDIATRSTRNIHDASLVIRIDGENYKCCFTGDASDDSLNKIAKDTTHYCDDILHASHHGSINGSDLDFIKKANCNYTIVSTKSGVYDNIPHETALQRYRNNTKYDTIRTDIKGTIKRDF